MNLIYVPALKLQPTLPAVYGDELSYYEALANLQATLNNNTGELKQAFDTVYQMLLDGIGSGVAISYEEEEENIEFVVSSDIKPEEPLNPDEFMQALEQEAATRAQADNNLSERITQEANTREQEDTTINNTLDTVAPATYDNESEDVSFGGKK